ncbi:MAG: hypothetical protein HY318_17165 [Armatimonadetes bacterium]|nr:hypothetical protein [Armatimonadota bacterium]
MKRVLTTGCLGCGAALLLFFVAGAVITYIQHKQHSGHSSPFQPYAPPGQATVPPLLPGRAGQTPGGSRRPTARPGTGRGLPPVIQPAKTSATKLPALSGKYVGEVGTRLFHRPDCPKIARVHKWIDFPDREQALQNRYEACTYCRP